MVFSCVYEKDMEGTDKVACLPFAYFICSQISCGTSWFILHYSLVDWNENHFFYEKMLVLEEATLIQKS